MANKLKLTRDQLASFLKDAEQIKQFEQLFALADSIAPDVVNEININAGNAQASANDALAQLQRLADAFELVETPPPIEHNNSIQTDYVDINPLAPTPVEKVGRLYWTDDDATLEFGLEGGVTGQICQQLDFHPKNTGATQINKGMAVMATGVIGSSTKITCARAVADGSVVAQYMLGIAAQNIPVNSFGYVVWFGSVRGFNTTGANKTVPEVWVDGDILYFDPNYPGELTKIQPSAPDLDLPIAIVTNAANNGSIFVRMKTGESMNELHDVSTATATNGDLLQYYGAGPYWRNVAPSTVSVGTATNLAGGAAGSVPYQSGASTTTFLGIGTADQVLAVNASGTAPEWDSTTGTGNVVRATSPTLVTPLLGTPTSGTLTNCTGLPIIGGTTGTLSADRGGTGQSSYAVGDLLYADTASSLAKLADVATGNALISGGVGVVPAWGKIGLTTHVSGTLPVANGGTGLTSGTSGGVLYYSASGTIASSGVLASNALVVGGGAGVAPSTITTGTGVITALGVNTGTAGAFVVNGGALGTPSSGTLTSCTGLPLTTGVTGVLPVANGGTGTSTAFTQGYVVFAGASGVYSQNGQFFWDNTNFRLGINTTTPETRIHARQAASSAGLTTNALLTLENTNGDTFDRRAEILFKQSTQAITAISSSYTGFAAGPQYAGALVFATKGTADATVVERMRIDSSGRLGIAVTSPSYRVDVDTVGTSGSIFRGTRGTSQLAAYQLASSTGYFGMVSNHALAVVTNDTERMRVDTSGNVLVTGIGGLGYGTGSGGAVTQATSRTTGVTLDKTNGAITLVSAAGTTTWLSFTVTNNKVAATDVVKVCQKSGTDLYMIHVTNVAAGSFRITFATTGGTTTEQPVFNFAIIKAVTS